MNLQNLLNDHRLYHSELQQDYFITTRNGGTIYGQYKQALRELYKRFRGLKELYYSRDTLDIDIEELEHKLDKIENTFEYRRAKIDIEKKKLDKIELAKNISDTELEFKRFYLQSSILKNEIGELTEEKRRKLDTEMWIFRLKETAFIDYSSNGRLKNTTIELIGSLPLEYGREILSQVNNKKYIEQWYWEDRHKENIDFSNKLLDTEVDIPKILGTEQ